MCRRMKSFLFTATGIFEKGGSDVSGKLDAFILYPLISRRPTRRTHVKINFLQTHMNREQTKNSLYCKNG